MHDGVAQRSAHGETESLTAILIPNATWPHGHGDGPAACLVDQNLTAPQVAAACQNSLAFLGLVGLMVLSQGVCCDGPVGIAPAEHGARITAIGNREAPSAKSGEHTRCAAAAHIKLAGGEIVLHDVESALHVHVARTNVLRKGLATSPRHVVTVFSVAVKDAVKVYVTIVKLFDDEKVVLVDPIGVTGFQAFDGGYGCIVVLLGVHGERLARDRGDGMGVLLSGLCSPNRRAHRRCLLLLLLLLLLLQLLMLA